MWASTTNVGVRSIVRRSICAPKHWKFIQRTVFSEQQRMMDKFQLARRVQGRKNSVWNEYRALDIEYSPINLGEGFPDSAPPSYVTDALVEAALDKNPYAQQYTRGFGHIRLVQAIAKLFSGLINRPLDPMNEVLVTIGAYEAIFSSLMGHINEGDEVVLVEPFFDCYYPIVRIAGGIPRCVPLRQRKTDGVASSRDFYFADGELEAAFNEKTKAIILNSPLNPLGKVYTREEMERIAAACRKWNVLCISDEVYEWMIYEGNEHIRICTLPGMWERTITIGSAGKTFCATGWKIGWAYGPSNILENLRMVHQDCVYTCPRPIQEAVAISFELEMKRLNSDDCYFHSLTRELQKKRDFMGKFLADAGMSPIIPEGGYFILADWSPLASKIDLSSEKDDHADFRFTKWMIKNVGLQGIPPSVFYSDEHKHIGEKLVRYCFIKDQKHLEKAAEIFRNWNL